MTPTRIYVKSLLPVLSLENKVKALAHITGGGLPGNVDRILPKTMRVVIDANQWTVPPIFGWIAEKVWSGRDCAMFSYLPSLKLPFKTGDLLQHTHSMHVSYFKIINGYFRILNLNRCK